MDEQVTTPISRQDRISALPDEIISIILSKLHVEESARTSILSKRWCKMWLFSPITISEESLIKQSCIYSTQEKSSSWMVNAMSHIISTHPGPVYTCHFSLYDWAEHRETIVNLLKTLAQKGIRNLQIDNIGRFLDVPCFVVECDSLVDVQLHYVRIPDRLPTCRNIFPNLRKLALKFCPVNDGFVANLLSSKPIIELTLSCCFGIRDVVIESDSLQKFYFTGDGSNYANTLVIKEAPNLESFEYDDISCNSKVVISNAPKLKVLSCTDMVSMLQLGNYQFKCHKRYMKISGKISYMPWLRSLDITINFDCGYEVKSVPHFLMCFPCIETLYVCIKGSIYDAYSSSYRSSDDNDNADDAAAIVVDDDYDNYVYLMSNINCLNHHLKNLWITTKLCGEQAHLDFIKLIIANAKVLETVTIDSLLACDEEWVEAQRQMILQNTASNMMLRVEFLEENLKYHGFSVLR